MELDVSMNPPTVVLGYEQCPAGVAALQVAADLVRRLGGTLHVVHAVAPLDVVPMTGITGAPIALPTELDPEELERQLSVETSVLEREVTSQVPQDTPHTVVVRAMHPAALIAQEADRVGAYMVVVGATESGFGAAIDRALRGGSTAHALEQDVRHHARWPLLVVPSPDKA